MDGQANAFTGLAALAEDVTWGDAAVTIGQLLGQEGALDEKYEQFPGESTGWIMTKPTFYNHVLPLDITANKGS